MGNANCKAVNLSSKTIRVETYNFADIICEIPANTYNLGPNESKTVEALPHGWGLKVRMNHKHAENVPNGGTIKYLDSGHVIKD